MIGKKISLLVLLFLFLANNFLYAQDSSDKKNLIKKNEPIEIVSDRMENLVAQRALCVGHNGIERHLVENAAGVFAAQ